MRGYALAPRRIMASLPGVLSFPAGATFLGAVEATITTSGNTIDLSSLVDDGDLIRVEYLQSTGGDLIVGDTWSNTGFKVRTSTADGLREATGVYPDLPLTFVTKTASIVLALLVYRIAS